MLITNIRASIIVEACYAMLSFSTLCYATLYTYIVNAYTVNSTSTRVIVSFKKGQIYTCILVNE